MYLESVYLFIWIDLWCLSRCKIGWKFSLKIIKGHFCKKSRLKSKYIDKDYLPTITDIIIPSGVSRILAKGWNLPLYKLKKYASASPPQMIQIKEAPNRTYPVIRASCSWSRYPIVVQRKVWRSWILKTGKYKKNWYSNNFWFHKNYLGKQEESKELCSW